MAAGGDGGNIGGGGGKTRVGLGYGGVGRGRGKGRGWGYSKETESHRVPDQEADPSGITLVDSCNGFNNLSRLAILWTVRHCWPSGAKFASNCYKAWAQLLLRQLGGAPVTIMSQEGLTQ